MHTCNLGRYPGTITPREGKRSKPQPKQRARDGDPGRGQGGRGEGGGAIGGSMQFIPKVCEPA